MTTKLTNQLLGLPPEVIIEGSSTHLHAIEIIVKFPAHERECPDCGSHHCVIKSSPKQQTIHHTVCSGLPTLITFKKKRFLCRDCGRSFYSLPDWIHPSLHMTMCLYREILFSLIREQSLSSIAKQHGITDAIVKDVLDTVEIEKPLHLPSTLCIDEHDAAAGTWNPVRKRWDKLDYICTVVDGASGVITDVLPYRESASLKAYFKEYPLDERRNVRFFCCDMYDGYMSVCRECFPNAVIAVDPFHVILRLNRAVNNVRIRLQNEERALNPEKYSLLKRSARLLITKESNRKKYWGESLGRREMRLDTIYAAYPELCTVCDALQNYHALQNEKSYSLQRAGLGEWIRAALSSNVKELVSAAGTIRHYRSYIENSWKYGKSNGPCEGLNRKIENLTRVSYGIHDFDSLRTRILITCGYMRPGSLPATMQYLLEPAAKNTSEVQEGGENGA